MKKNNNFSLRAFGGDVLIYSLGQAFLLAFGLIQSLIIPKYLSTADYGYWQLFLLYATYGGVLHLGFLDGMLVRWAGRDFQEIKQEIPAAFKFLLLEQLLVVGTLALILVVFDFPTLEVTLIVLVNAIITNALTFFIFTAQAAKKFKLVTIANTSKGALLLLMIIGLFVSGNFGYGYLCLATIAAGSIILVLFVVHLRDSLFPPGTWRTPVKAYGKENINIGIYVLLGNFTAVLLVTVDRLTVSSFFSITQFAQYTFAMSMCTVVIMFVQAVSQVFFPYLSGSSSEIRTQVYRIFKPTIIIFWAGALTAYFPFTAWVKFYLPNYAASLPLMAILLCMTGLISQTQILHVNYFKAYKKQRLYFILAGLSLVSAAGLYFLAATYLGTLTSIAITTVISSLLWYLLNEFSLRRFTSTNNQEVIKWLLVIGGYSGVFLATVVLTHNWMYGTVIYLIMFTLVTGMILRSEVTNLLHIAKTMLNRDTDRKPV
ncbi:hypothetical protein [Methanoculleus sp. 10]|jgi:O-antigen/teichoic acid export membrane protein|uniref:lipopolysaccharide biosynthesis protein n=1 Tax=Methanoculleus sp. 10 TaxID=430615 RepID=UPI0025DB0975|nr:hypothetical protein [Methanoculleus sp. 10]